MVDIVGGLTSTAGDAYDAAAGSADHLAGSLDEAFARQFDDTPGGGLIEGAGETAEAAGSAVTDGVAWAAGGYTGAVTEVGQSVIGDWFQWWMLPVALGAVAYVFRDEIGSALGLYATGGASAVAGGAA